MVRIIITNFETDEEIHLSIDEEATIKEAIKDAISILLNKHLWEEKDIGIELIKGGKTISIDTEGNVINA